MKYCFEHIVYKSENQINTRKHKHLRLFLPCRSFMKQLVTNTHTNIGGYLKPAALANVFMLHKKFKEYAREDIDIVGVGGIGSGKDAFEMILCGAKAVQLGTIYWNEGPSCFHRIVNELKDFMLTKGYTTIEDFRGKLKPYYEHEPLSAAAAAVVKGANSKISIPVMEGKQKDTNALSGGSGSGSGGGIQQNMSSTSLLDRVVQVIVLSIIALAVTLYTSRYYWASK